MSKLFGSISVALLLPTLAFLRFLALHISEISVASRELVRDVAETATKIARGEEERLSYQGARRLRRLWREG